MNRVLVEAGNKFSCIFKKKTQPFFGTKLLIICGLPRIGLDYLGIPLSKSRANGFGWFWFEVPQKKQKPFERCWMLQWCKYVPDVWCLTKEIVSDDQLLMQGFLFLPIRLQTAWPLFCSRNVTQATTPVTPSNRLHRWVSPQRAPNTQAAGLLLPETEITLISSDFFRLGVVPSHAWPQGHSYASADLGQRNPPFKDPRLRRIWGTRPQHTLSPTLNKKQEKVFDFR